jgi:hypothetical protein
MGQVDVISLLKGSYEEFYALMRRKNKANLSLREQTQYYLAPSTAGGFKNQVKKTKPIFQILVGNPQSTLGRQKRPS